MRSSLSLSSSMLPQSGLRAVSGNRSNRSVVRNVIVILTALAGIIAFVNVLNVVISGDPPSFNPSVASSTVSAAIASSNEVESRLQRLPASLVRIEFPGNQPRAAASSSDAEMVRLVMTVDQNDLTELMEAYKRNFAPEPVRYPEDSGIVMHNRDLCRTLKNPAATAEGATGNASATSALNWIVVVHSAPDNAVRRQMLRDTWANVKLFKDVPFRVVFLLGRGPFEDVQLQADLKAEFDKFGDLVQGNFIDSYKNMTLKAVLGLRWVSEFCPEAAYVMKADDDTFLNVFELVSILKASVDKKNAVICPLWADRAMPILRDPKTCMKWCVRRSEFRGQTHFPQYCAGIGYVMTRNLIPLLYNASHSTPFFWIDDVYVTGLLVKKLPFRPTYVDLLAHFTTKEDAAVKQYEDRGTKINYWYVHAKNVEKFWQLWKLLIGRLTDEQKSMVNSDVLAQWLT